MKSRMTMRTCCSGVPENVRDHSWEPHQYDRVRQELRLRGRNFSISRGTLGALNRYSGARVPSFVP